AELLDRFDLTDAADRRVGTFSGGMRRRLDIAISLLPHPAVLVLDEPTTGLDPRSRQAVWRLVAELSADGVTDLLTTQYLEEADALADRVAVLHGGRIVGEGTPAELKRLVGDDVVEVHWADGAVSSFPTTGALDDVRRILTDAGREDRPVARPAMREPSLDDAFLHLTHSPAAPADVRTFLPRPLPPRAPPPRCPTPSSWWVAACAMPCASRRSSCSAPPCRCRSCSSCPSSSAVRSTPAAARTSTTSSPACSCSSPGTAPRRR